MALAILTGMSASEFALCVHNNDVATLVKLPGVGKKTAERLVIEMRDRLGDIETSPSPHSTVTPATPGIAEEAESALVALGYKPQDAAKMVSRAESSDINSAEQLIRAALKSMVSK
jgi:Holliday junction DNA helicase RuvA